LQQDPGLGPDERVAEAGRRVGQVHQFLVDNPDALHLDLRAGTPDRDGLSFPDGADEADRARLVALARSYQRAVALADGDVDAAATLVAAGYSSAIHLARAPRQAVLDLVTGMGGDERAADRLLERARSIATAAGTWGYAGIDVVKGGFDQMGVANTSTRI